MGMSHLASYFWSELDHIRLWLIEKVNDLLTKQVTTTRWVGFSMRLTLRNLNTLIILAGLFLITSIKRYMT